MTTDDATVGETLQRGRVSVDLFIHDPARDGVEDQDPEPLVAAVVVVRDDDTCTVAWGPAFQTFDKLPGTWPNRQEAMRAVVRVVSRTVVWTQTEANLWEARV